MQKSSLYGLLALVSLVVSVPTAHAFGVGHHGGIIINCTPPLFFDEFPARDAEVTQVRDFSFVASDNADAETLKVWVNNQPVEVQISKQPSGRLAVKGRLPETITSGRVWFKVTGVSDDGCDQLHNWYVYVGGATR